MTEERKDEVKKAETAEKEKVSSEPKKGHGDSEDGCCGSCS